VRHGGHGLKEEEDEADREDMPCDEFHAQLGKAPAAVKQSKGKGGGSGDGGGGHVAGEECREQPLAGPCTERPAGSTRGWERARRDVAVSSVND
jgi:hypothetical protein